MFLSLFPGAALTVPRPQELPAPACDPPARETAPPEGDDSRHPFSGKAAGLWNLKGR
jgi:hypothetical protein